MNRLFTLLVALTLGTLPVTARTPHPDATPIAGIYQLYGNLPTSDSTRVGTLLPVWKIYGEDGSFVSFFWPMMRYSSGGRATKMVEGRYTLDSDDQLTEYLHPESVVSDRWPKGNTMDYWFDGSVLNLRFEVSGEQTSEQWYRFGLPVDKIRSKQLKLTAKQRKRAAKMVGIWQLSVVQMVDKEPMRSYIPAWKIFFADGTFTTFSWQNSSGTFRVSNNGDYRVKSDKAYTEYVTVTATDPELMGRGNEMRYSFPSDDLMQVSYRMPGRPLDAVEQWQRIDFAESPTAAPAPTSEAGVVTGRYHGGSVE